MAQQTERPEDTGTDLDQTAELFPLDVAAYEQRSGSLNGNGLDERAAAGLPQQFSPEVPVELAPAAAVEEAQAEAEPAERGERKPPAPAGA